MIEIALRRINLQNDYTKDVLSDYLRNLGRKGEKALAKRLTPQQRSEKARKAALARWGRKQETPNDPLSGT